MSKQWSLSWANNQRYVKIGAWMRFNVTIQFALPEEIGAVWRQFPAILLVPSC